MTSIFGMLGVDLTAPDHTTLSRRGQHLALALRRARWSLSMMASLGFPASVRADARPEARSQGRHGSDNWGRGLPLSAVSIAVLPVDGPLQPDRVSWAMVGELREPLPLTAGRGHGAYRGSHRIRASGVRALRSAFLSCELNHFDPTPAVGRLLQSARAVRTYGCASQAITLVATGALDVHIDVRDRLTAESFLAAALILEEAGGCVVTGDGHPIRHLESLVARTSLVAAATPELAHEVLNVLSR